MAYTKVTFDAHKITDDRISRLKEFKNSFAFTEDVSLVKLEEANAEYKAAIEAKNAVLDLADEKTKICNAAASKVEALTSQLRTYVGLATKNESDAFVALGGTRQSDVIAKQQQTREEKKKNAEVRRKVEGNKDTPK